MLNNLKARVVEYISLTKDIVSRIGIGKLNRELLDMWYTYADKLKTLAETNFKLGVYHFERGYLNDAIFRFKLLKIFCDKYPASDYYLARCYIEKFKYERAAVFLSHYFASGDSAFASESKYCKKLISNELGSIVSLPGSIVAHNLDKLAYNYIENSKVSPVDCSLSEFEILKNIVKVSEKPFGNNILHIGSKLGRVGRLCRSERIADVINGIEVSKAMCKVADPMMHENVRIYTHIGLSRSFEDYFKSLALYSGVQYDIVILSDILSYLLDIKFVVSSLNPLLHSKSLVLISFEKSSGKAPVFIRQTERFTHNAQSIKSIAEENGLTLLDESENKASVSQKIAIMVFSRA